MVHFGPPEKLLLLRTSFHNVGSMEQNTCVGWLERESVFFQVHFQSVFFIGVFFQGVSSKVYPAYASSNLCEFIFQEPEEPFSVGRSSLRETTLWCSKQELWATSVSPG